MKQLRRKIVRNGMFEWNSSPNHVRDHARSRVYYTVTEDVGRHIHKMSWEQIMVKIHQRVEDQVWSSIWEQIQDDTRRLSV